METIALDRVPFRPDPASIARELGAGGSVPTLARLCEQAAPLGRPRALYGAAFIRERGEDFVIIEGERFHSRVLAVNVLGLHRVFPLVVTCGPELDAWAAGLDDNLERYLAEGIKGAALRAALLAYERDLAARFGVGKVSTMTPGSLPDWPLTEQRQLFRLLGDTNAVGVCLLESMFMKPSVTVSGIAFESEHDFQSCRLCDRKQCPGRRAPFSPEEKEHYLGDGSRPAS